MMRVFAVIGLGMLAGCRTPEKPNPPLPAISVDSPELEVMEAVLKNWTSVVKTKGRNVVLSDRTMSLSEIPNEGNLWSPGPMPVGLNEDYKSKNQTAWRIPHEVTNRLSIALMPSEQVGFLQSRRISPLLQTRENLSAGHSRTNSIFEFSRVGFDSAGGVAVLVVRYPSGSGDTWTFRKDAGDWKRSLNVYGPSWIAD